MPLNIDLQQILLHLFNFIILAGALYFLLYKPVRDFMSGRINYYQDQEAEAERMRMEAEQLKEDYEKRLEEVENEIRDKKNAAAKELEQMAAREREAAQAEADQIIGFARAAAEREKEKMVRDAQKEIAKFAEEAAEKLAYQSASSAFDEFLDHTEGSGTHE